MKVTLSRRIWSRFARSLDDDDAGVEQDLVHGGQFFHVVNIGHGRRLDAEHADSLGSTHHWASSRLTRGNSSR